MKHPLFKILIFLILGIYCEITFSIFQKEFHLIIIFNLFLLVFFEKVLQNTSYVKKILFEFLIAFSFVVSGIILVDFKNDSSYLNYIGNSKDILESKKATESNLRIYESIVILEKLVKIKCEILTVTKGSLKKNLKGKILIYLTKDSSSIKLMPGDEIRVKCNFKELSNPKNPHQFNYSNYLSSKQIQYSAFVKNNWKFISSSLTIKRFSTIIRDKCLKILVDSGLKSDDFAIASALTFGYKDELSQNVKGVFSKTGSMHVLAVSGLHVGIIFLIISSIFNLFKSSFKFKILKQLIIILTIWFYAFITGLTPSVLRATTMLTFFSMAEIFSKSSNIYNILASSAILLLIINPYLIVHVGFQLSFLAVFGIIYMYPLINNLLFFESKLLSKIWAITSVSISAQVATFPISIYYFHQFPNFFILSNLLVIPTVFVLLILGLLIILFSIIPSISFFLAKVMSFLISLLVKFLFLIESLPYSTTKDLYISKSETVLIYMLVILVLLYTKYHKKVIYYLIFFVSFLIIGIDFKEDYDRTGSKRIIVYSLPNYTAIDLVSENEHYFIAKKSLFSNKKLMNTNIKNNWSYNDLSRAKFISLDTLKSKTIKWENKSIALIENEWEYDSTIDFAILNIKALENSIIENENLPFFIISNSRGNKIYKKQNFDFLKGKNLLHELENDGAFIYDFKSESL